MTRISPLSDYIKFGTWYMFEDKNDCPTDKRTSRCRPSKLSLVNHWSATNLYNAVA